MGNQKLEMSVTSHPVYKAYGDAASNSLLKWAQRLLLTRIVISFCTLRGLSPSNLTKGLESNSSASANSKGKMAILSLQPTSWGAWAPSSRLLQGETLPFPFSWTITSKRSQDCPARIELFSGSLKLWWKISERASLLHYFFPKPCASFPAPQSPRQSTYILDLNMPPAVCQKGDIV